MLRASGLTKSFDGFLALDSVDMDVPGGSIYGLVGTNGAGKTTILKLLAGVFTADAGEAEICGVPVSDAVGVKDRFAFIPDDLEYYTSFSIDEAGRLFGGLYSRWDAGLLAEIASGFGLDRGTKLSRFSKGMCKQAVFALSLATTPDCLLLDEPIDGLDPIARKKVWEYIVDASADRGMTTLVSSHNLREMEGFCDRIGVIDRGVMKLERDIDDLTSGVHKLQVSFGASGASKGAYDDLDVRFDIRQISSVGSVDHLIVKGNRDELLRWRDDKRPLIFDLIPMTLEEVFIFELGGESDDIKSIIS